MLLLLLIIGLRLGGVSIGLLSGLGLGLLTFSVQPTAPPNDLMLLQTTWFLLMSTLEAAGFFYLLQTKLRACIEQIHYHYGFLIALFCYGLVFLTGDKKWLQPSLCDQNGLHSDKARLFVPITIAAHMALLASPLSISGIPLIVVARNSGFPTLALIGVIVATTVGLTMVSSLLASLMPNKWLIPLCKEAQNPPQGNDEQVATVPTGKMKGLFVLLLLAALLFLVIKPESNRYTELSGKIYPVRFPIFFALVMLSIAAVVMLGLQIKPAKILQTHRFKLGIQQFFIFLGLTWLLDSLISHDKAYLIKMVGGGKANYGCYLLTALYMLLIDLPIVIWLFSALLIEQHCGIVPLALSFVIVHSLAPIRWWVTSMVQAYKNTGNFRKQ